jgi:very-short-patch-repair endonuclease
MERLTDPAPVKAKPGRSGGPRRQVRQRTISNVKAQQLLEARSRSMRLAPTASEARLWEAIRAGKLGARFVRQVPLGGYIVDFLAPRARLVLEVDGGYHAVRQRADARRDRVLERLGYRVLRIQARAVHEQPRGSADRVANLRRGAGSGD